jgi:hypothetical protein
LASISTHFFVTSAGFAEKVFISEFPWTGRYRREHRTGLRGFLKKRRATVNARERKIYKQNQYLKIKVL